MVVDISIPEDEAAKAIKQMLTGKAPVPEAIPAVVCKSGFPSLLRKRTDWDVPITV